MDEDARELPASGPHGVGGASPVEVHIFAVNQKVRHKSIVALKMRQNLPNRPKPNLLGGKQFVIDSD